MGAIFRLSKKSISTENGVQLYEVLVRLHSGTIDQYAKTGVFVPEKYTDRNGNTKQTFKAGFIVIPKISYANPTEVWIKQTLTDARERLAELVERIDTAFEQMRMAGKQPPKGWLDNMVNGKPDDRPKNVIAALDMFITSERNPLGEGSKKMFRTVKGMLERYQDACKTTLTLDGFTADVLDGFVLFACKEERRKPMSGNYITATLRRLRTFIRWANGLSRSFPIEPLTSVNVFTKYSVGTELYGTPFYLTLEERNKLADAQLPPQLAVQRDIFIFQCLIGCRVSDLLSLTR